MSLQFTHTHKHTYWEEERVDGEWRESEKEGGSPDAKAAAATESCPRSFRFDSPFLLQFKFSSISPLVSSPSPFLSPLPFLSLSLPYIFSSSA